MPTRTRSHRVRADAHRGEAGSVSEMCYAKVQAGVASRELDHLFHRAAASIILHAQVKDRLAVLIMGDLTSSRDRRRGL